MDGGAFCKSLSALGCLRLSKQQLNFHQDTSLSLRSKRNNKKYPSFTSNQVAENDVSKENQKYNLLIEACNDSAPLTLDSLCKDDEEVLS